MAFVRHCRIATTHKKAVTIIFKNDLKGRYCLGWCVAPISQTTVQPSSELPILIHNAFKNVGLCGYAASFAGLHPWSFLLLYGSIFKKKKRSYPERKENTEKRIRPETKKRGVVVLISHKHNLVTIHFFLTWGFGKFVCSMQLTVHARTPLPLSLLCYRIDTIRSCPIRSVMQSRWEHEQAASVGMCS